MDARIMDPGYLAGLIDGEGCFTIGRYQTKAKGGHVYAPRFALSMRADDPAVEKAWRATGLGTFNYFGRKGRNPVACWQVARKDECLELVRILDAHPLEGKKARDYAVWRHAVELMHAPVRDRGALERLKRLMERWRAYKTPKALRNQPEQLLLEEPRK